MPEKMKSWLVGAGILLGLAILVALIGEAERLGSGTPPTERLVLLNWPDYTPPELLLDFENTTGIKVVLKTYESNEDLLAVLQSPNPDFDLVVLSHAMVAVAIRKKLLARVTPNVMENFANLDPRWVNLSFDPGRMYSVPYAWGTASLAVNSRVTGVEVNSLWVLFNPPSTVRGRIALLDDESQVIDSALRVLGLPRCSANSAELGKVEALLTTQKKWVRYLHADQISAHLASGELYIGQLWNQHAFAARQHKPSILYVYPKEGISGWMDNLAVPKGARNLAAAKKFLNWFMTPKKAAMVSNFVHYHNGIQGSVRYMKPELAGAPEIVPPQSAPVPNFGLPCPDAARRGHEALWRRVRG